MSLIENIMGAVSFGNTKEEEIDSNSNASIRLGLIVGHTLAEPGAKLAVADPTITHEWGYNREVAKIITEKAPGNFTVLTQFRDGYGIIGAYQNLLKANPDCIIELHFNAFDQKSSGTQTLCTPELNDLAFAKSIHWPICRAFQREGDSRGVKAVTQSMRGAVNLYAAGKVPNCLVEPFFGDNPVEATFAVANISVYADAILTGVKNWATINGMLGGNI